MAVCLHCLHNARVEARERRRRVIIRFSAWTLSLIVVGVVGGAAVNAAMNPAATTAAPVTTRRASPKTAAVPKRDPTLVVASATVMQQGAPSAASAVADSAAQPVSTPAVPNPTTLPTDSGASRPAAAAVPAPVIRPVIPMGRTDLRDSVYLERRGDTVVVHFDASPTRTRRADKFEAIVRQTLHSVYGAVADTLLAAVPAGSLVAPNELVTTLPSRGLRLGNAGGARIQLWPETRPGRDGPLVVAYRTVVEH